MIIPTLSLLPHATSPQTPLLSGTGDPFAAMFAAFVPSEDALIAASASALEEDEEVIDLAQLVPTPEDLLAVVVPVALYVPEPTEGQRIELPIPAGTVKSVLPKLAAEGGIEGPHTQQPAMPPPQMPGPDITQGGASAAATKLAPLAALPPAGLELFAVSEPPKQPAPPDVPENANAVAINLALARAPLSETGPTPSVQHSAEQFYARPRAAGDQSAPDQQGPGPLPAAAQISVQGPTQTPVLSTPAAALAQQLAIVVPRLRQSGGEAVLTLDPARLGRVTLSWQSDEGSPSVITVRAIEPATAALLTQLSDDIAARLRSDPALADRALADLRLDIVRAERSLEARAPDPRPTESAHMTSARDLSGDAGLARNREREPAPAPMRPQGFARGAVNPDDPAQEVAPRPVRADARARLA